MRTQALACAFLCSFPASAAAITIMPLGDSITAGYTGDPSQDAPGGYRNNLYADLTADGIDINFVGTSTQNPSPLLTANNETENEGASGYLIQGVPLAGYPGGFYPGLLRKHRHLVQRLPAQYRAPDDRHRRHQHEHRSCERARAPGDAAR